LLATAGGLVALAARSGITNLPRAAVATVLVAVIYLALGVLVGTLVRSDMNGALVVTLAWVFDVFFGPGLGSSSLVATRLFPIAFPDPGAHPPGQRSRRAHRRRGVGGAVGGWSVGARRCPPGHQSRPLGAAGGHPCGLHRHGGGGDAR